MNTQSLHQSYTPENSQALVPTPGLEVAGFKMSDRVALALIGVLGTLVTGVFTLIALALRGS